jgi:hypothetical protein
MREIEMGTAVRLVNDVPMIPVQAAFEAIQAQVSWDENTNTMTIRTREYYGKTVFHDGTELHMWATIASDGRLVLAMSREGSRSFLHNMRDIAAFFYRHSIVFDGEEISAEQLLEILLSDAQPMHLKWLEASPVTIILDGINMTRYRPPGTQLVVADGRLFAPYNGFMFRDYFSFSRWCFETDDMIWSWEGGTAPIHMDNYAHNLRFELGSTIMESVSNWPDTVQTEMGAAPFLIDDMPFVPVRAAFEGIQARIEWEAGLMTISTRSYMYGRTVLLDGEENIMWATQALDGRTVMVIRRGGSTSILHRAQDRDRRFGNHIITMDGERISMETLLEHLLHGTGGQFVMEDGR